MALTVDDPIPVARAESLYLWDEYGTEFLDFASWQSPLGHRPSSVANPVAEHWRYYGHTAPAGRHLQRWPSSYARALSDSFTGPDEEPRKVLFCEGGREALSVAVRFSTRPKSRVSLAAVLDTGWHSWLTGEGHEIVNPDDPVRLYPGVHACLVLATHDVELRPVPHLRDWISAARAAEVPVIIDESVTGFGRTGTVWGQERTGLVADVTVLGGPAGGGLPLGAAVAPPSFFAELDDDDVGPLAGHPWSCAAGQATLEGVHQGLLHHVAESSAALDRALRELVGQFPHVLVGHHGTGLLRGLRFSSADVAESFPAAALAGGLHLSPARGATVPLVPALVSSVREVTRGVDLMADVLLSWDAEGSVNLEGSRKKR